MPLLRVLLPLCGLLLALAATAVSAGAPVYGSGEVMVRIEPASLFKTRREQIERCEAQYASALLPAVTDAVHQMVTERVDRSFSQTVFGYMGGSSMSSFSICTTFRTSIDCIWSWDQGRYLGVGNEVPFYKGNRDPNVLAGAGMVGTAVSNHWRVYTGGGVWHPGEKMQRYGAYFRDYYLAPTWADTSDTRWSYGDLTASNHYTFCAVEQSTTTTTLSPEENSGLNLPLVIGVSVGGAVALGIIVGLALCATRCCGCCCSAGPAAVADRPWLAEAGDAYLCDARTAASQRGGLSRASSVRSHRIAFDGASSRSFHNGASSKEERSRRSSVRDDVVMEEWQDSDEEASAAGSRYRRASSTASMAAAPPPGLVTMTMTMPAEMVPMPQPMPPPQLMPQPMMPMPPPVMRNDWQTWEAPQPVEVYTTEPPDPPVHRRSSSFNFAG